MDTTTYIVYILFISLSTVVLHLGIAIIFNSILHACLYNVCMDGWMDGQVRQYYIHCIIQSTVVLIHLGIAILNKCYTSLHADTMSV